MAEVMDVIDHSEEQDSGEFEVMKITSRKDAPDGIEHLYEVHWKDGDVTFEPVSNLSGASDALRQFLESHYPEDSLLKLLSAMHQSEGEEENEVDGKKENGGGIGKKEKLSFLARWHQKTTRGSTQYWLRKGDDNSDAPSLLNRAKEPEDAPEEAASDVTAPLAPASVPDAPQEDVSAVLFSEEEEAPASLDTSHDTPGHKVRRRVRVVEETVKMFPHEELYGPDLEQRQNKTLALWRDILSFILLAVPVAVFIFIYYSKQPVAS